MKMAFSQSIGLGNSTLLGLEDENLDGAENVKENNSLKIKNTSRYENSFEEDMKIIINDSSFACLDTNVEDDISKALVDEENEHCVDIENVAFTSTFNVTNNEEEKLYSEKELKKCFEDVSQFFENNEIYEFQKDQNLSTIKNSFRKQSTTNSLERQDKNVVCQVKATEDITHEQNLPGTRLNPNTSRNIEQQISKHNASDVQDLFENTFNDTGLIPETSTDFKLEVSDSSDCEQLIQECTPKGDKSREILDEHTQNVSASTFVVTNDLKSFEKTRSGDQAPNHNSFESISLKHDVSATMHVEKNQENIIRNEQIPDTSGKFENNTKTENTNRMSYWNLPTPVLNAYEKKGVTTMFDWQVDCLLTTKVLRSCCNLVYSAPTSAGKTLISEILAIKTLKERKRKVLLILPFISVAREKMYYLQDLLTSSGYRVDGFFGGYSPPRGFDGVDFAICTIEKSNTIINRLLEEKRLDDIGLIIIDEAHLISDPGRGYILELLLAKVLFVCQRYEMKIQIAAMSATLPNIDLLAKWLQAELYLTNFRPVVLSEMLKIGASIYDSEMRLIRELNVQLFGTHFNDPDNIIQLCIETLVEGNSTIVFCPSKDWCESLCQNVARGIYILARSESESEYKTKIKDYLNREQLDNIKMQLRNCPAGLDSILEKTISFGCAYHHAGLTVEEREIIEIYFKTCDIKILIATSTLSSGVNLPARRVIIRSPMFAGKIMSSLTYKQMIGRAGRTGKDTLGESILICNDKNSKMGLELISSQLKTMKSCMAFENNIHFKRGLLEIIASGIPTTKNELQNFMECTLLHVENMEKASADSVSGEDELFTSSIKFLEEYEFIRLQLDENTKDWNYIPTRLGLACLSSSIPPTEGLVLFSELQKARQHFNLETELHAIYLVTPISVCYQMRDINWLEYIDLWDSLSPVAKRVGKIIGIKESFLIKAMRGQTKLDPQDVQVHKRFYISLALQELINESQLNHVARKFNCNRGLLQNLQQMASVFAGIMTSFCISLKWDMLASILSQFKDRLYFGIHQDLMDLMRLPDLVPRRARALYEGGIRNLVDLANARVNVVEKVLYDSTSFESEKTEGDDDDLQKQVLLRNLFVTGQKGISIRAAAKLLIDTARDFVQRDMGGIAIKWTSDSLQVKPQEELCKIATNGEIVTTDLKDKTNKHESTQSANITALNSDQTRFPRSNNNSIFSKGEIESIHIVDVCADLSLFQAFEKELLTFNELSLSVGVENLRSSMKRCIGESTSKCEPMDFSLNDETFASGVSICVSDICFFINLQKSESCTSEKKINLLKTLLNRTNLTLKIFESRQQLKIIHKIINEPLRLQAKIDDPKVAMWLLHPDGGKSFRELVRTHAPQCLNIVCLAGRCRTDGSIGINPNSITGRNRCCIESFVTSYLLQGVFKDFERIDGVRLLKHYHDIEMPIQSILLQMEVTGFPVVETDMIELCEQIKLTMKEVETKIYKIHGSKFNLLSSASVGRVLQLEKKSNKRYKTTKHILEQIQSPLSILIVTYRKLNYILRQNIQPLIPRIIGERIHGNSTTYTSTGRISMHEPNLQNVAKNFEIDVDDLGRKHISCRSVFKPPTGNVLISADYCQLEFRILSHLSNDQSLKKIMTKPGDIFQEIAAEWNGLTESEVTPNLRDSIKQVLYGIIYGMSAKVLSENLKCTEKEACSLVDQFHEKYPGIRKHISKIIAFAQENGYIETINGRRRYLPNINNSDSFLKSQAERQAVNSAIQGSAADIVKCSTLQIIQNLQKYRSKIETSVLSGKFTAEFVLHVHDELIFEVNEKYVSKVASIVGRTMENCVQLSVPLPVRLKCGQSWGCMKDIPF